jgi:hypothetical protein
MKTWHWMLTGIILSVIFSLLVWQFSENRPTSYNITFTATVGESPLVLNSLEYDNPSGPGTFKIRSFQFYISNIRLISDNSIYTEPESYHLVRFDSDTGEYLVTLENVPSADYKTLSFGIGVDPIANGSIESFGDLDPNGRMAWNWEVGYKFVLFEGLLTHEGTSTPLVYHIGFDENYKAIGLPIDTANSLAINVDVRAMFTQTHAINIASMSNVKFDRTEAALLADNYAGMISLKER